MCKQVARLHIPRARRFWETRSYSGTFASMAGMWSACRTTMRGPGFCFTVGVYLRTLQPEILLMGVPIEPTHRVLNAIAGYLMAGGTITPETRYPDFVDRTGRYYFARSTRPSFMSISAARTGSIVARASRFQHSSAFGPIPRGDFLMRMDLTPALRTDRLICHYHEHEHLPQQTQGEQDRGWQRRISVPRSLRSVSPAPPCHHI